MPSRPPATSDPYSHKPAPIGAAKTSANFFTGQQQRGSNALGGQSSHSLFGGDSTSQPVAAGSQKKQPGKNNFTNVVGDEDIDDWDKEDSPTKTAGLNKAGNAAANDAPGGMGFFNRAPG